MSDAAPAPVVQEATNVPPPPQVSEGSAALADLPVSKQVAEPIDESQEFELDIRGQKQKIKANRAQLTQILQKSLYADQMIKDATQAKRGAEAMMAKLKSGDIRQIREIFSDPAIGVDIKKLALEQVREMMEDEGLTDEQRENRKYKTELEQLRSEKKAQEDAKQATADKARQEALAVRLRTDIVTAMKEYQDLPQTQATMDACIQYMRANFRKFGKTLPAADAMKLVSRDYWGGVTKLLDTLTPDKIIERFGKKTLDKLQQLKLKELRDSTNPATQGTPTIPEVNRKRKSLTEKEYDKQFAQRIAGL